MKIGIIGSGNIGGNLGIHWAHAGHQVMFSSRHPEQLTDLVKQAGENARAGTREEAVAFGEVIFLATPYRAINELALTLGKALKGKVLVDATNPYPERDGEMAQRVREDHTLTASQYTAREFSEAHVGKAFNTISSQTFRNQARPGKAFPAEDSVAIPYAADDAEARRVTEQLITDVGFVAVYMGTLADSAALDPDGTLYGQTGSEAALRQKLDNQR